MDSSKEKDKIDLIISENTFEETHKRIIKKAFYC